jgi:hypothetical protein
MSANASMKFDFPDPFAPIRMLIWRKGRWATDAMLLNPLMEILSIAGMIGPRV